MKKSLFFTRIRQYCVRVNRDEKKKNLELAFESGKKILLVTCSNIDEFFAISSTSSLIVVADKSGRLKLSRIENCLYHFGFSDSPFTFADVKL